MPFEELSDEDIKNVLASTRTIAVVGLSPNPERESHRVANRLKEAGYRIIPVNPGQSEILGEKAYPSLLEVPDPIDVVDIFRNADAVPEIVDHAITVGAKVVWMQTGITHEESAQRARSAGIQVVQDRCLATAHALFGPSRTS